MYTYAICISSLYRIRVHMYVYMTHISIGSVSLVGSWLIHWLKHRCHEIIDSPKWKQKETNSRINPGLKTKECGRNESEMQSWEFSVETQGGPRPHKGHSQPENDGKKTGIGCWRNKAKTHHRRLPGGIRWAPDQSSTQASWRVADFGCAHTGQEGPPA